MNESDFEKTLRFKAGAGIVPLCRWVRELRAAKAALDGTNDTAREMVGGAK